MKCYRLLVSMLCLMAFAEVSAGQAGSATKETNLAEDAKSRTNDASKPQAEFWYVAYVDDAIGLTGEQKESMYGIIRTRNKSMWEYQVQNAARLKAAGNALVAAYRSMNSDSIVQAQRDYQELQAPLHQLMKRCQDDLMQLLTPDQRTRLVDFQITKAIEATAAPVQLSDDQIQRIKTVWPKASDLDVGPAACDQAVQQVLTPEQKAAISTYRAMAFIKATFGRIELTENQLKQAELVAERLSKDPSVKPEEFHQTLTTKIQGLLTPEQKEVMKKPWTWNEGSPGSWGVPNAAPGKHDKAPGETDKK